MQIIFHKSGVDPDFKPRSRFDLDASLVIESIAKRLKESDGGVMSAEMNKKLEEALTAKVEIEAKYEQQLKLVQDLQGKMNIEGGSGSIPPPPPPPPPPCLRPPCCKLLVPSSS